MESNTHEVLSATAGEMRPEAGEANTKALTEAQWTEIEDAYFGGQTARQAGERFGVSASAVYQRVGANGKLAQRRALDPDNGALQHMHRTISGMVEALIGVGRGLENLGRTLIDAAVIAHQKVLRGDRKPGLRKTFAPEIWQAAKRDYEEGDFTAREIAERYGMVLKTVETHAHRDGWSKKVMVAPPPLLPPDDPQQVDAVGDSIWPAGAHAAQLPPEGAWATWLFQGGRGAGKTRAGAEWLAAQAEATPNGRFALIAPTEHDLREVMIEGASGLRSLPGREHPKYESSRRKLKWNNGAIAYGFSAEQPERLRGPQFMAAWADEFCAWRYAEDVLSNLRLGLRLGNDPRLVVTTTPKPIMALRKLREEVSCVMTQAATSANAANLAPRFIEGVEALYGGTRLAEQELGGVLLDGEGSLWKQEEIAQARSERPKRLDRVVVAIDPPAGMDGSACGIVVAGRLGRHGYVLADRSAMGLRPLAWAKRAVEAAEEFGASRIVAEANQGGEMVRDTLQTAGVKCRVDLVHASRSKRARAEPVSALYQLGKVHHCGVFRELEEELMAMGVGDKETGLDRADALVWAICALKLTPNVAPLPSIRQL
ncbi:MAG: terminase family protein [Hyphomonadaceae bacterium]|nr:terminase family protein [Hyphomonadaceae bacterium]